MRARHTALGPGLAALAKAGVLVVGVPLALARLWFLAPSPPHLLSLAALGSVPTWAHLAVVGVAILWALAAANLVRDVRGALRRHETIDTSSWSARWAVAIAGLILVATAGTSLAPPGSFHLARPPVATAPAPPHAAPRSVSNQIPARRGRTTINVEKSECLADVADRATGCADDWPLLARLNLGHLQVDGTRMLDPARLRPGWRLQVPNQARPSTAVAVSTVVEAPSPAVPFDRRLSELAFVGLGIVTTCALARRVRNLRRAGASARRLGERRALAPRTVGRTRAALEPFAEAPLIDWIDLANRLLGRLVRDQEADPPDIRLVRAGPDGIELLLAASRPEAPWPFLARRAGRWWVLDPALEPGDFEPSSGDCSRFIPPLVPLGDDEQASYLLAVGPGRRLGIDGTAELVDRTLAAIVTSLRTVPWAEELSIELIGIDPPPPDEQCYQLNSSTPAALEDLTTDGAAGGSRPLGGWRREPLIVVGREAAGPECESVLTTASAVAGIVAAGSRGTERLVVDPDHAVLLPYGIELTAVAPSAGQFDLVEGILAEARRPTMAVPIRGGLTTDRARLQAVPVAGPVEVQMLRPEPVIVGLRREPSPRDAARVVELLAYLALHDGTAPAEAVGEAIFARSAGAARSARFENILSAARAVLGPAPSGRPLVVRRRDGVTLDPSVTCDLIRARRALASAGHAEPPVAETLLVGALELVTGPVLGAVSAGYSWFGAEMFDELITAEIVDGAHHLVTLALAADRIDLARWAIERGRHADENSEILTRDLMAVASAQADAAGVRRTFVELERVLERLGGGEPSLETRALLEALDPTP